jgi:hypothetical protein
LRRQHRREGDPARGWHIEAFVILAEPHGRRSRIGHADNGTHTARRLARGRTPLPVWRESPPSRQRTSVARTTWSATSARHGAAPPHRRPRSLPHGHSRGRTCEALRACRRLGILAMAMTTFIGRLFGKRLSKISGRRWDLAPRNGNPAQRPASQGDEGLRRLAEFSAICSMSTPCLPEFRTGNSLPRAPRQGSDCAGHGCSLSGMPCSGSRLLHPPSSRGDTRCRHRSAT